MEKIKAKLEILKDCSNKLNEMIKESIIAFVEKAGGSIELRNENCDAVYGFFYNEGAETYEEHKILSVKVEGKSLLLYADVYPDDEENWFTMDFTLQNATLYNLCECIHEYV